MKKILFIGLLFLSTIAAKAQTGLAFPFQGGKQVMMDYFKTHIAIPAELSNKAAAGTVIFKFTADEQGSIKKIIVYYADDLRLTQPLIEAIKQSDRKWIIPDKEKLHDFILPFNIAFNAPAAGTSAKAQQAVYEYYASRKPVLTYNQVPLDMVTLLPAVTVNYDLSL
ncbi:hypothetical protein GCM10027037_31830 [Mucilaginibacter koreensis]